MTDTTQAQGGLETAAHETLVAGLRNAHGLEKQAITVLEAQLGLLGEYPDLHARLTAHITETRDQARRLEAALEACGASTSMLKDALLSMIGLGQSSVQGFVQGFADDAVLKAMLADIMTEHLEVATYRTLLTLADMAGKPELRPRLEESLREEEAMVAWLEDNLDAITRRFIEIKSSERPTDKAAQQSAPGPDGDATRTPWYARDNLDPSGTETLPRDHPGVGVTPERPAGPPLPGITRS